MLDNLRGFGDDRANTENFFQIKKYSNGFQVKMKKTKILKIKPFINEKATQISENLLGASLINTRIAKVHTGTKQINWRRGRNALFFAL